MIIRCSLDSYKDKVLSRASDDSIDVFISVEVAPRQYQQYVISVLNLDGAEVGIFFWPWDHWNERKEIASVDLEPE